jgi:hypothetical protein
MISDLQNGATQSRLNYLSSLVSDQDGCSPNEHSNRQQTRNQEAIERQLLLFRLRSELRKEATQRSVSPLPRGSHPPTVYEGGQWSISRKAERLRNRSAH